MSFTFPVRIYYEDTDAGGVVYYANYLKFAERARTEWLRSYGFDQQVLWRDEGIGFVVKHCAAEYHAPAKLDDLLSVSVQLTQQRKAGFTIEQVIARDDTALVTIHVTIICVTKSFRPTRLPDDMVKLLAD